MQFLWNVFWQGGRMKQEWNWMMDKKPIGNSFPPQKVIEHLQKPQPTNGTWRQKVIADMLGKFRKK